MIITNGTETFPTPNKSLGDKKEYKLIKLPNGLKAVLSTHPDNREATTGDNEEIKDKSSAVALCVHVGSFSDLDSNVQGICHFIEHMVS